MEESNNLTKEKLKSFLKHAEDDDVIVFVTEDVNDIKLLPWVTFKKDNLIRFFNDSEIKKAVKKLLKNRDDSFALYLVSENDFIEFTKADYIELSKSTKKLNNLFGDFNGLTYNCFAICLKVDSEYLYINSMDYENKKNLIDFINEQIKSKTVINKIKNGTIVCCFNYHEYLDNDQQEWISLDDCIKEGRFIVK